MTLAIGDHDKLGIGGSFVKVKFILIGGIRDKTRNKGKESNQLGSQIASSRKRVLYLSSSPPNFRTILRKENTVPKTNLASSSVTPPEFSESGTPLLILGISDVGREDLLTIEVGRGNHLRL